MHLSRRACRLRESLRLVFIGSGPIAPHYSAFRSHRLHVILSARCSRLRCRTTIEIYDATGWKTFESISA